MSYDYDYYQLGPRYIIRLQPELQLVSSLLYYSCIFTNKYKLTPGITSKLLLYVIIIIIMIIIFIRTTIMWTQNDTSSKTY